MKIDGSGQSGKTKPIKANFKSKKMLKQDHFVTSVISVRRQASCPIEYQVCLENPRLNDRLQCVIKRI